MPKGPDAFRTISEAAETVGVPQHVLRFWETKFPFVAPVKRSGGRRFYRPQDIVILQAVRRLLHEEGLTIKGVQRLHKDQGLAKLAAHGDADFAFALEPDVAPRASAGEGGDGSALRAVLADLERARARLDAVLAG